LAILADIDAALDADPQYATGWVDILVTDLGRQTCDRILDRRAVVATVTGTDAEGNRALAE